MPRAATGLLHQQCAAIPQSYRVVPVSGLGREVAPAPLPKSRPADSSTSAGWLTSARQFIGLGEAGIRTRCAHDDVYALR